MWTSAQRAIALDLKDSIAATQPPTPTGFTKFIGDDFPVLHLPGYFLLTIQNGLRRGPAHF